MFKEIIPQIFTVISAAVVLFLIGRKIPGSLEKLNKEHIGNKEELNSQNKEEEMKEKITRFLEKMLRKAKVAVQKSDAKLMEIIKHLQLKRGEGQKLNEELNKKSEIVKRPILKQVSDLKERLVRSKSLSDITSLRKKKVVEKENNEFPKSVKSSMLPFSAQKPAISDIDIEEAKRAMFDQQERMLIKKISLNPKDDSAYAELGKLYQKVNNIEDARASFKQALKINKGNIVAKKLLKEIG